MPLVEVTAPQDDLVTRSTSSRPLLYLDVDGVINAISYGSPKVACSLTFRARPLDGERDYLIRVPDRTADRVAQLAERFDMVWATTWEHSAPQVLSPHLGFGADWPVVQLHRPTALDMHPLVHGIRRFSDPWTVKLDSVLYHAADRPCAWVDDILYDDAREAFERRAAQVAPSLLVCPDEQVGLTDEHVDELLTFADTVR